MASPGSLGMLPSERWEATRRVGAFYATDTYRHAQGYTLACGYGEPCKGKELLMASILEAVMLICFGLSWPINAMKAWRARTAAGTSLLFLCLITTGYVAGISAKFIGGMINWVLIVYFINLAALVANLAIYARNKSLDKKANTAEAR